MRIPEAPKRRCLALCAACACLLAPATARAATLSIDGISDQSLPAWNDNFATSYFAGLFRSEWVADGSIRYARYVVQWNVMSGAPSEERTRFESWLGDVASLGLTPDVSLTSYDHVYPRSTAQYSADLAEILEWARAAGHPVPYVEAWNEPNNQGAEPAAAAAGFATAADVLCEVRYACAVIAGDFEDNPRAGRYELEYERGLGYAPRIWGVHPYWSVEERSEAPYLSFLRNLPREGAGQQVWITEIAARACTDYGGALREYGEAGQALRAEWLVRTLMHDHPPAHAFYYDFALGGDKQPSCAGEPEDDSLYVPSGPGATEDRPRAAARFIWGGSGLPGEFYAPGAPPAPFGLCPSALTSAPAPAGTTTDIQGTTPNCLPWLRAAAS